MYYVIELMDTTKKVFINETCFKDRITINYILKKLYRTGFSKDNIIRRSDLYLATEGDYEIRYAGGDILISQVELKDDKFSLRQVGIVS